MDRAIVDLNTLDQLVRDELDKIESSKVFGVALWRQDADDTGANWNAFVTRLAASGSSDNRWCNVVPKLRAAFSLTDDSE